MLQLKDAILWLDHRLIGEWADYRECHIGCDFLLIYQVTGNAINFIRAGTHAELFERNGYTRARELH